jgi:hypothetical protein
MQGHLHPDGNGSDWDLHGEASALPNAAHRRDNRFAQGHEAVNEGGHLFRQPWCPD